LILVVTSAGDGTVDRIVSRIPSSIFRLNFDQLDQFKLFLTPDHWEIVNPAGLVISSSTASKAIWWKALVADPPSYDKYCVSEARYIVREIYAWFERRGLVCGNSPLFAHRWGKLATLGIAKRFFHIPSSVVSVGGYGESFVDPGCRVVKSLSSELVGEGKALFTTDVSDRSLANSFPWFIQEKVAAVADVTVLNVGKSFYSFKRSRAALRGLDWRAEQTFQTYDGWEFFCLAESQTNSLRLLAGALEVSWGRYDFMLKDDGTLVFLEFNPNGQWVFLDLEDKYGLLDAVVRYLES
jgi:hypothetical protein